VTCVACSIIVDNIIIKYTFTSKVLTTCHLENVFSFCYLGMSL